MRGLPNEGNTTGLRDDEGWVHLGGVETREDRHKREEAGGMCVNSEREVGTYRKIRTQNRQTDARDTKEKRANKEKRYSAGGIRHHIGCGGLPGGVADR